MPIRCQPQNYLFVLSPRTKFQKLVNTMPQSKKLRINKPIPKIDPEQAVQAEVAELYRQGLEFHNQGKLRQASNCYAAMLDKSPEHFGGIHMLGVVVDQMGNPALAAQLISKAISINPSDPSAHYNLGGAQKQLKQFEAALVSFNNAISLDRKYAAAHFNRGYILAVLMNLDDALLSYDKALDLNPELLDANWNKSHIFLLQGDFKRGWKFFESGWDNRRRGNKRNFTPPLWQGAESLAGKSILLHAEQGLGDTIQFCRYARLVSGLGAKVFLEVPKALLKTLVGLEGVSEFFEEGKQLPAFDYHCPLLSLPFAFKTELGTIPCSSPYLRAEASKLGYWQARLCNIRGFRVGVVWSGGFRPDQPELWDLNERRNIPLQIFSQGLQGLNVNFFSLQKGEPSESEIHSRELKYWPRGNFFNFSDELKDFSDTAALIANLDLVISVDTSTAHLAAALGKPTWILNRFDTCWRWLLDRNDSPWYDSVRLYRQGSDWQWSPVLQQVSGDLSKIANVQTNS